MSYLKQKVPVRLTLHREKDTQHTQRVVEYNFNTYKDNKNSMFLKRAAVSTLVLRIIKSFVI